MINSKHPEVNRYHEIARKCLEEANHPNVTEEVASIFMEHYKRAMAAMHIADIDPIAADRVFNNIQH